ncbi:MAG TPA: hypothetical protein VK674_05325 [Candidatus Limnocylindria bacterium]|nr:hypothetical protein [Candidatus Limnocylindria bacterium]
MIKTPVGVGQSITVPGRPTEITVASANTHFGRLLTSEKGLEPLSEADVLLLQEVTHKGYDLCKELARASYKVVHAVGACGLAIALHEDSNFGVVEGSQREDVLQAPGAMARQLVKRVPTMFAHCLWQRSVIAAKLKGPDGQKLTAAATHLVIPLRSHGREAQVTRMGEVLRHPYYDGPLILGGDMNHYPGPQAVDLKMREISNLREVDTNGEPTWRMRSSKQQWWGTAKGALQRETLDAYDGQLDDMLYRGDGLVPQGKAKVVDVESDHRAVIARFLVGRS